MRLYLYAESKNKIGYIPDWLKINFRKGGELMELTLDIQGEIDFSKDDLSCRCKGDLIPWVLYDYESGDETDLYSLTDAQIENTFTAEEIAKAICESENYEVGIYPAPGGDCDEDEVFEKAKRDTMSKAQGSFEMVVDGRSYYKEFVFATELTIY